MKSMSFLSQMSLTASTKPGAAGTYPPSPSTGSKTIAAVSSGAVCCFSRSSSCFMGMVQGFFCAQSQRWQYGKGDTWIPPLWGPNPLRKMVFDVVMLIVSRVRPWYPPCNTMMLGLPVACLASFTADSTASAPEFHRKKVSREGSGITVLSLDMRSSMGLWYDMLTCECQILSTWACTAAVTLGWQWPRLQTPIPVAKSRYFSPSVVYTHDPSPLSTTMFERRPIPLHTASDPSGGGQLTPLNVGGADSAPPPLHLHCRSSPRRAAPIVFADNIFCAAGQRTPKCVFPGSVGNSNGGVGWWLVRWLLSFKKVQK
eukprot:Hpha_TRINITY_DN15382_c2_g10::TRINITY_DN15382_c2_g10_i1::g.91693::m.91693